MRHRLMSNCSVEVSIVVPTYNEAETIRSFLSRLRAALDGSGLCYEVLVVDDDSPDGTWRIVEEESRRDGRIRLVRRIGEKGLATAVIEGIRRARGRYVVVMDADLQHPPDKVLDLVREAEKGYDIVVASRYMKGGGVEGWSRVRLLMSMASSILAKIFVAEARKTSDPMSGFFLVRRDSIDLDSLKPRGYKILLEILAKTPKARVSDIPYIFRRRAGGESKLGARVMIDYLLHLVQLSRLARFGIVGGLGAIANLMVMYLTLPYLGVDLASIAGIEAGILWNYILHESWTFKSRFTRGAVGGRLGYHAASRGGITTTYLTMRILYTLGILGPIPAQGVGIIAGFLVNYMLSSRVVWRRGS